LFRCVTFILSDWLLFDLAVSLGGGLGVP